MKTLEQQLLLTENTYITPLVEVLETNPSQTPGKDSISPSIKKSLQDLFPEQEYEEKQIKKAKEILGAVSDQFTPEHLKNVVSEVQYLTESLLDEFERGVFKGQTLQELLHEKGTI